VSSNLITRSRSSRHRIGTRMGRHGRPFSRFRPVWTGMTGRARHRKASETISCGPVAGSGGKGPRGGWARMHISNTPRSRRADRPRGPRRLPAPRMRAWRDERARHAAPTRRGAARAVPAPALSARKLRNRRAAIIGCVGVPPATAGSRHWPNSSRSPPRARHRRRLTIWCSSRAGPARRRPITACPAPPAPVGQRRVLDPL
jgi:hypothetical protein